MNSNKLCLIIFLTIFQGCIAQNGFGKTELEIIKQYPPVKLNMSDPINHVYRSTDNIIFSYREDNKNFVFPVDELNDINESEIYPNKKALLDGKFTIGTVEYKLYGARNAGKFEGVLYKNNIVFGVLRWDNSMICKASLITKDKLYEYTLKSEPKIEPKNEALEALLIKDNPKKPQNQIEENVIKVSTLSVSDYIYLFTLSDIEQVNILQNSGWKYVKAVETHKNNSMMQCVVFKNNGTTISNTQIVNQWTILNDNTGLTTKVLELNVYDVNYIENFIKEIDYYHFKLIEKKDGKYSFRNADSYINIDKVILKDQKIVYKIKIG